MIPQEKAKELVDRYKDAINATVQSSYSYSYVEGIEEAAKQCAIIAVDEILKYLHSIDEDSDLMFAKEINELESVKQEIEKL